MKFISLEKFPDFTGFRQLKVISSLSSKCLDIKDTAALQYAVEFCDGCLYRVVNTYDRGKGEVVKRQAIGQIRAYRMNTAGA